MLKDALKDAPASVEKSSPSQLAAEPVPEQLEENLRKRHKIREENLSIWSGKRDEPSKNLDTNIKKNTAFITKCRAGLTADTAPQLLQGIKSLKLEKYLSEIIAAIVEGLQRCKTSADVAAAVEIISALHQRFPDSFTIPLNQSIVRSLQPPAKNYTATLSAEQREREELARVQRQRPLLRMAGELWLMGLLRSEDEVKFLVCNASKDNLAGLMTAGVTTKPMVATSKEKKDGSLSKDKDLDQETGGVFYSVLKDLLAGDKSLSINISLAVVFSKHFGNDILGIIPRRQQLKRTRSAEEDGGDKLGSEEATTATVETGGFVTEKQRAAFKALIMGFHEAVSSKLVDTHKTLKQLEQKNGELYIKIGGIPESTKSNLENLQKQFEKFSANAQMLSDCLDVPLPDLTDEEDLPQDDSLISNAGSSFNRDDSGGGGIWEDEEERTFYEDIIDLKDLVPPVLLLRKGQKSASDESLDQKTSDETRSDEELELAEEIDTDDPDSGDGLDESNESKNDDEIELMMKRMGMDDDDGGDDDCDEGAEKDASLFAGESVDFSEIKPGRSSQLEALITRLGSMINRDMIDKAAVEFCYMNSKGARKRLVKVLLSVQRSRMDLLPYYSRLIATLNKYIPEVAVEIIKALDHEFRFYMRSSSKKGIEVAPQIRNVRYIGELTKFQIIPSHIIFHTLKLLIERFKAGKVEVCCNLVECCGRYLLRNPATSARMKHVLEIMMRKKGVQHLEARQLLMIENAYYMCCPPDRAAVVHRKKGPLELYIRKLVYSELTKKNVERVLKQLRKLPWPSNGDYEKVETVDGNSVEVGAPTNSSENVSSNTPEESAKQTNEDEAEKSEVQSLDVKPAPTRAETALQIYNILIRIFTKVWKVRYNNVHLLAIIVQSLSRYHSEFSVQVIDHLLEDIRFGLESNIFKHNQRRISQAKYLGELYNYRAIDSPLIFDTLYTIVTLGHEQGRPSKERPSSLDSTTDFFRVRLCCTLLNTCGMCFDRGSSRIKLDAFLAFFQMYFLSKERMPMDVEFMISDTFETLRPNLKLFETYEEANEAVDAMLLGNLRAVRGEQGADKERQGDSDESDDEESDREEADREAAVDLDERIGAEEDTHTDEEDEDEDEVVLLQRQCELDAADTEADQDFEREFGKMMTESADSRKFERKATFDLPLPVNLRSQQKVATAAAGSELHGNDHHAKVTEDHIGVAFTLLTKKGHKQQSRMLEIPSDSPLAVNTKSKQEAKREEQQKLKQLVLSYEEREQSRNNAPAIEDPYRRIRQDIMEDAGDPMVGPVLSSRGRQRGREQRTISLTSGGGPSYHRRQ